MSPALSRNRDTGTFGRHEVALFRGSAGLITLSSCIGFSARSCPRDHIVVLAFRGSDGVRRVGKGASRRAHRISNGGHASLCPPYALSTRYYSRGALRPSFCYEPPSSYREG